MPCYRKSQTLKHDINCNVFNKSILMLVSLLHDVHGVNLAEPNLASQLYDSDYALMFMSSFGHFRSFINSSYKSLCCNTGYKAERHPE